MTTKVRIANIAAQLPDLDAVAGEDAQDLGMVGVRRDFLAELNKRVGSAVHVTESGDVLADPDVASDARDIEWSRVAADIDVAEIMGRHDIVWQLAEVFDPQFEGPTRVNNDGGEIRAAWGPDIRDDITVGWVGTRWDNDRIVEQCAGTREHVEAIVRAWLA